MSYIDDERKFNIRVHKYPSHFTWRVLIFGDLQIRDFREIKEFKDKVISKFPKNETTNTKKDKIMKRLFLLLALCSMVAVGCTEGGENEIPDDAYITLNKEVLTFVPDGESVEVKVRKADSF